MPTIIHLLTKSKPLRRKLIRKKRYFERVIFSSVFIIALCLVSINLIYQYISDYYYQNNYFDETNHHLLNGHPRKLLAGQFPESAFTKDQINSGMFMLYLFGMLYTFVGIAIVCDSYFVPTLEVIVEKLNMAPDVAGATWLAAGGSTPELFTSFIGTFIAQSDVGFGTIIGSAVFNVLFVIGICAIVTEGDLPLSWFPFARDMTYYLCCLCVLAVFFGGISVNVIRWYEALTLFALYILYVYIMSRNEDIKGWVFGKIKAHKSKRRRVLTSNAILTPMSEDASVESDERQKKSTFGVDHFDSEDEGPDIEWPSDGSLYDKFYFCATAPLAFPIYFTLVDVTEIDNYNWWPWTFFGSLMWLGSLSYCMVWFCVIVGKSWGIPDELMGIIFLAAGTSVPELFSCVIVAQKGEADMAVSGSIGSNVFDILVGLPIPWLSFCCYQIYLGQEPRIEVVADNLFFSLLLLLFFIGSVLFVIMWNKWTMTTSMGVTMITLYCLFVAQDCLRFAMGWEIAF